MAPQELEAPRDPAHRERTTTVDTNIVRKDHPEVLPDEAPHACYEGFVYIGHMVEDSETGEEVEVFKAVPCKRCRQERR